MADRVYRGVVTAAMGVFRGLGLRFDVVGAEHAPATGGGVLVMNHTGYADFALAGAPFWWERRRLVRFMAKKEVFAHPVSGPLMRAMRHIPVDRAAGGQAFRDAVSYLKDGEIVGVFPEATISTSFTVKDLKAGAARMAVDAGVPIIPAAVWGGHRIATKGKVELRRNVPVTVILGEPIVAETGEKAQSMLRRTKAAMEQLLDEAQRSYPDQPAGPDDRWWLPAHLGGTAPTPEAAAADDAVRAAGKALKAPRRSRTARLRSLVGRGH
jgi:1-acyl-sn-glycerol-3-phosphate acyltransferase